MLNILTAILLFGFIVLIHEFGHFLLAKLNGICVVEFSVGMGPRLLSFTRGETKYSLKCLPFGGSCMMLGEDSENPDPRAFAGKTALARFLVIAAGPVFNFILAFLFALIIVAQVGHDSPVLHGVADGSPAQEAGLMAGDKILRINNRKVTAYRDVMLYTFVHPGEQVTIQYSRPLDGSRENGSAAKRHTAVITPEYNSESQSYMLGVSFGGYQPVHGILELLRYGAYEVKYCITSTFDSIGMMLRKKISVDDAVTGPIGIVSMVGETVEQGRQEGARAVLLVVSQWILLLSSSLGIMNLIPIPALDGGRLLFILIELVRGKPMDPEKEGMVHLAGMMFLMALMVLVLFNDIRRLF